MIADGEEFEDERRELLGQAEIPGPPSWSMIRHFNGTTRLPPVPSVLQMFVKYFNNSKRPWHLQDGPH